MEIELQFKLKPEYSFNAAKVTENTEKYEVEIEVKNRAVGAGTEFNDVALDDFIKSFSGSQVNRFGLIPERRSPPVFLSHRRTGIFPFHLRDIYGDHG